MKLDIITIFPDYFESPFKQGLLKKALDNKVIEINVHNLRDYSADAHKNVDDTPYGGGAGMVMTCQPIAAAIESIKKTNSGKVIFLTPQGKTLTHSKAKKLADEKDLILLCGRYEGVDQRIRDRYVDEEISIGDYVLNGGEVASLVLIEAVTRFIPGFMGKAESHLKDSFSEEFGGKREYPHYTKPADYKGQKVPDVLLSGNHAEIEKWREEHMF